MGQSRRFYQCNISILEAESQLLFEIFCAQFLSRLSLLHGQKFPAIDTVIADGTGEWVMSIMQKQ